jgi:transposase
MRDTLTLPTITEIPDDLWLKIQSLLPQQKMAGTCGRPAVPFRRILNGIFYVLRTGCQWKAVPREFGTGSTIHRRFQQWVRLGVFEQLWAVMLEEHDELVGIGWQWQSLDSASVKSPLGGTETGENPTDRGKLGSKRHVLVDQEGVPLAVELSGANRHDMKMIFKVLDNVMIDRPDPCGQEAEHLCLDKGYDYPEVDQGVKERNYQGHTRRRGEAPVSAEQRRHPARRWVVERTHSWYNRFRKLLVRFEKYAENYLGLVDFASSIIVYRATWRLAQ